MENFIEYSQTNVIQCNLCDKSILVGHIRIISKITKNNITVSF